MSTYRVMGLKKRQYRGDGKTYIQVEVNADSPREAAEKFNRENLAYLAANVIDEKGKAQAIPGPGAQAESQPAAETEKPKFKDEADAEVKSSKSKK